MDIRFEANKSEFKKDSNYGSKIDNVIEMAGEDQIITIITNAAYPEHVSENTKLDKNGFTAGNLLDAKAKAIKDELVKRGVDESRIETKRGNVNSGTTKTDFDFKQKG